MSNINKHWSKLANRTMDHCLEGISPTKFRQDASMQHAPKWQMERESHVISCIVMTIKSHRGKWRRCSPTNAALRSNYTCAGCEPNMKIKMGALSFAKKTLFSKAQGTYKQCSSSRAVNALRSIMPFRHRWTSLPQGNIHIPLTLSTTKKRVDLNA